ncbi:MAG: ATP synthase F1 subunit epsilon [Clostridia bacterium]|nr:ATP synthase F1 subunit epsilon [Clostridia bacterium]
MEYDLKIVTPDKVAFDGKAERLVARSVDGDVCILARHVNYMTALSIGQVKVRKAGEDFRVASCSGGTLIVTNGSVLLIASTFEWADEIDIERAQRAKEKAEKRMQDKATDYEMRVAEFKLKRALNRLSTGMK